MTQSEIEQVLSNWIGEALSDAGQLPEGTDRAVWVAHRFSRWWKNRVSQPLEDAELAASSIHDELVRQGGWERFGEALHEHCHLMEALADLRSILGLAGEERTPP
jgi:hypothetical protein